MLLAFLGGLSLQEEALPLDLRALIPPVARFTWKELPAAKNAYPALLKLQNERSATWVREFLDDTKPMRPRELVRRSQADAEAMDRALARGGFQWPRPKVLDFFPSSNEPFSNVPRTISVGTLARFRAQRATAFSRLKLVDRATREVEAIYKLSRGAGAGNPLAIHYLFAATSEAIAARSLGDLVREHRLTKAQIARLRKAIGPFQTVDPDLILSVRVELNEFTQAEYAQVPLRSLLTLDPLLTFGSLFDGESESIVDTQIWPVDDPDLLDRRMTFSLLAQVAARALPNLARPWALRSRKPDPLLAPFIRSAVARPWDDEGREPKKEELAAFRRAAERVPNAFGLFKLQEANEFELPGIELKRLTYRALSLAALNLEAGESKLPLDPATLKPLRYDPKRRMIYGVGANGLDEKGRSDDITLNI